VTRRNASLKPQLNQIRTWVQEGATDIWIAHKLGSTPASISRFRRQHDLRRSDEDPGPAAATVTEAEVAESAAAEAPAKRTRRAKAPAAKADGAKAKPAKPAARSRSKKPAEAAAAPEATEATEAPPATEATEAEFTPPAEVLATAEQPDGADGEPAKRRRGRRGGRGRSRGGDAPLELEAVFDHGEEGYGLWLDGAVRDAGVYRRHWQGHSDVVVKITPDEIVIRRAGNGVDA